jgi:hypothetical protein
MKKTIKRRTEITIETHQTLVWRTGGPQATDCTPDSDDLPEVLLFSEVLPQESEAKPDKGPSAEGDDHTPAEI